MNGKPVLFPFIGLTSLFSGLLRLHGGDVARLQRVIDPVGITLLFVVINRWTFAFFDIGGLPTWFWVALSVVLVFPRAGIYASYRSRSLYTLARRVSSSWALVLTTLLLLSFFTKSTASFSRLDASLWAITSWMFLLANHVGMRKLLR